LTDQQSVGKVESEESFLQLDALTKAVLQSMQAAEVAPIHKINLCCQSFDNAFSALLMSKHPFLRDHGSKLQHFGNEYVRTQLFPAEKARALKRYLRLWAKSRYGQKPSENLPLEEATNFEELSNDLLDFAIRRISGEKKCSVTELMTRINSHAMKEYFTSILRWRPKVVPGYAAFETFEFIRRIREECRQKDLLGDYNIGSISGLTHSEVYGLPHSSELTEFEREILSSILWRLKQALNDLRDLKDQIEFRKETGQEDQDYNLRWRLAFDNLISNLHFALEDEGLEGLAALYWKWDNIIEYVRRISTPKPQSRVFKGSDRFNRAKAQTKEWLSTHTKLFSQGENEHISTWSFERELRSWNNISKEDELNRIGIVVTPSPKAMERFAGRIENQVTELWEDFPTERVRQLLDLEETGVDINEFQMSEGVPIMETCLGLRDLAHLLRRRGITTEEEQRLRNWDWFIERAGLEGSQRLKKFIDEERQRESIRKRKLRRTQSHGHLRRPK
jgi:hypothetical protein